MRRIFKLNLITDTLILAGLTVLFYGITFTYQVGYFSYFNVPSEYIEINLNQVFIVTGSILLFFYIFFTLFEIISRIINYKSILYERICLYVFALVYVFPLYFLKVYLLKVVIVTMLGILAYIFFIKPKLQYPRMNFEDAVKKIHKKDKFSKSSLLHFLINFLSEHTGNGLIYFGFIIVFILMGAFYAGLMTAMIKHKYYVMSTNKSIVLIATDEENFIFTSFTKDKHLTNRIYLYSKNYLEKDNIQLIYSEVGFLKYNEQGVINKFPFLN